MDKAVMIDVHQHPFVLPEDMDRFIEYLRAAVGMMLADVAQQAGVGLANWNR